MIYPCAAYTLSFILFFFFNDTATTEIYTLSLHDALPILRPSWASRPPRQRHHHDPEDRKSTRLNSSHPSISYAVFCLKKKKKTLYDYDFKIIRISTKVLYILNKCT